MIRPLRQIHRGFVFVLGIFLPAMFVIGIAARKPAPTVSELPAALAAAPQPFKALEWERADLYKKSPIQVQLLREQKNSGRFAVGFTTSKDFAEPDLLVYWVAGNQVTTNTLPNNAILLGGFGRMALPLPDEIAKSNGVLVLYSLADNEIVDISKPVQFDSSVKFQ